MTGKKMRTPSRRSALVLGVGLAVVGLALVGARISGGTSHARPAAFHASPSAPGAGSAASVATRSSASLPAKPVALRLAAKGSSPPLRDLKPVVRTGPGKVVPVKERDSVPPFGITGSDQPDGALQASAAAINSPAVLGSFEGTGGLQQPSVTGHYYQPPDTVGDVGPSHYVEMTNTTIEVFSKTGAVLVGPVDAKGLWSTIPSTNACHQQDDGDPIVLYDSLNDRWLLSQFAVPSSGALKNESDECIAISKTGDPTGSYWVYDFVLSSTTAKQFWDYPKFGVWPNGYYASFNVFSQVAPFPFIGTGAVAFQRSKMLAGQTATAVKFNPASFSNVYSALPADVDGRFSPPAGGDYYVQALDSTNKIEMRRLTPNYSTPSSSTFTVVTTLQASAFDENMCKFSRNCIPQNTSGTWGSTNKLDAVSDRVLQRLAYRSYGGSPAQERLVFDQTVDTNGADHAGPRWYELRRSGGAWTIFQQGTYSPNATHRWMGSAAMDGNSDIAVGYSASSSSVFPSVRYAARTPSDSLGTLQAETTVINGSASQIEDPPFTDHRWGDYSAMSVDPVDDCTFWYAGEYYKDQHLSGDPLWQSFGWNTRIARFRFAACVGVSSFSPSHAAVGTTVTINGVGFSTSAGVNKVKFNGTAATSVTPVSTTQVKAVVPSGATTGRITVTVGSRTGTSAKTFAIP